ncbi:MAG: CooT family nickel-binding protein [Candidatus Bathyarchaeota archaeon]|nr:CooT family nickel-binding protein [Candidatus Bathyarchaeota archaeon]MDH5689655.1 CooT family nickel-binding protein [Candidatus Bathyarchaeota archaeon]
MCEFDVILNGKAVLKDVIYAKDEGGKVKVRNILGDTWEYEDCKIDEVDVNTTRLVLSAV